MKRKNLNKLQKKIITFYLIFLVIRIFLILIKKYIRINIKVNTICIKNIKYIISTYIFFSFFKERITDYVFKKRIAELNCFSLSSLTAVSRIYHFSLNIHISNMTD